MAASGDSQIELQLSKPEGEASAQRKPAAPQPQPLPQHIQQPSRPAPTPGSARHLTSAARGAAPARPAGAEQARRPPPSGSIAAERARAISQPPAPSSAKQAAPPLAPSPAEVAATPPVAAPIAAPESPPTATAPTPAAPAAPAPAAASPTAAGAAAAITAFAAVDAVTGPVAPAPDFVIARPPRVVRRARDFARLMRLDRPIGIWLLLWPELWALWVASSGHPARELLGIFALGTLVMRSAGCVINDLFDRNIDPHVRRTQSRPLAARVLGPYEALILFAILLGIAGVLALHLDRLTLELAFVGAGLTITYPLLKRFFPFPQLYLGLAFGWAVPLAFAATQDQVPRIGWLLLLPAVLWAGIYDTMYAMADREDDLRIGVQSSAILFADMDRPMIGAMQIMMLLALWLVGRTLNFGSAYRAALIASAALFAWQQWLIRRRDRDACLAAFQNNQYVGIAIFAGILLEYASPA